MNTECVVKHQLYAELFSFKRKKERADLFAGPPKRHLTHIPVLVWEKYAKILVKPERKQCNS